MLIGLDPILSPELLYALAEMGHGDEIAVVDANFPATSCSRQLVRLNGVDAPRVVEAVLSVMPLDDYVDDPAAVMSVVGDASQVPEAVAEFQSVIQAAGKPELKVTPIDRFDFYDRARKVFAVVQTGERRLYGNIILKKGVVHPS